MELDMGVKNNFYFPQNAERTTTPRVYLDKCSWEYFRGRQFILFLEKLFVLGKIESDDFDYEAGKYYGYKKCCIENYILLNRQAVSNSLFMDFFWGSVLEEKGEIIEQVLCPMCLFENLYGPF